RNARAGEKAKSRNRCVFCGKRESPPYSDSRNNSDSRNIPAKPLLIPSKPKRFRLSKPEGRKCRKEYVLFASTTSAPTVQRITESTAYGLPAANVGLVAWLRSGTRKPASKSRKRFPV